MTSSLRTRARAAVGVAAVLLVGSGVVAMPAASASHPLCLDVSPEDDTNNVGDNHTLTATLRQVQGGECGDETDPHGDTLVEFEITGVGDPDESNTPASADLDCTIGDEATSCTVVYTSDSAGEDEITGWIDEDADGVIDAGEPQDVVTKTWTVEPAPGTQTLDCDDETGDDAATNLAGVAETYTCTVITADGPDAGTDPDPVDDATIDAENLNGANDPDNSQAAGTADFDDACTTGNDGTCTISIAPSEDETGAAQVCFWVDGDDDDVFDPAGNANDGGGCIDEAPVTENAGPIDVVSKTWSTTTADDLSIDCDDESGDDAETNEAGVAETYSCLVTGPDGPDAGTVRDPVRGLEIDAENLAGANDPDDSASDGTPDFDGICDTPATGTCTFRLTPTEDESGNALVCFWIDSDDDARFDPGEDAEDGGGCSELAVGENLDFVDVVSKTWRDPDARTIACAAPDATFDLGDSAVITCVVVDRHGDPVEGEGVSASESGAGTLSGAVQQTTDEDGEVSFVATSTEAGFQSVTATLDDVVTGEPDTDECQRAAGDPTGAPAGVCAATVTLSWAQIPEACAAATAMVGTVGPDTITGTPGDDVICTLAGNDVVDGGGGNDIILLGAGNDVAHGGADSDSLRGGSGEDVLRGGGGSDLVGGGAGRDVILGGPAGDELRGGPGNDSLAGGRGLDALRGGPGRDSCSDGARDSLRGCEV